MTAETVFLPSPSLPPPPEVPHPAPFAVRIAVGADAIGRAIAHVSNVSYVAWLDRVAELHADALGYTRNRMVQEGRIWFVGRHEVDYLAESHAGETLHAWTWVRDMRKVRSWRDTLVVRASDGRPVLRAATLWVLVDLASRKPIAHDAATIDAFAPLHRADRS